MKSWNRRRAETTVDGGSQEVSAWKIIRYLLWAYSFKIGIYFMIIGATLRTAMLSIGFSTIMISLGLLFLINAILDRFWVLPGYLGPEHRKIIAVGGFVYIVFAYIPASEPGSIIFGLMGGIIMLLPIYIFLCCSNQRRRLYKFQKTSSEYRMTGYFFFAMATYTLCAFMGLKTFDSTPEKMIQYGLQSEAASFAFHILIELLLGWLFITLSLYSEKNHH